MATYFPTNPTPNQRYPEPGDTAGLQKTGGVVFSYNDETNSWNIVGPDDIATISYVDGKLSNDSQAIDKGYDLIGATNDVGVQNNLNGSLSSACDNAYDRSLAGEVVIGGRPIEEIYDRYIKEWSECVDTTLGSGEFTAIGHDPEKLDPLTNPNGNNIIISKQYQHITQFLCSTYDTDSAIIDWDKVNVGDTIELNYIGGVGFNEYAIYNVLSIEQEGTYSYSINVKYFASSDGEAEFKVTSGSVYYNFKTFQKSYTTSGGTINGPVRIEYTGEAFVVVGDNPGDTPILTIDNTKDAPIVTTNDYDSSLDDTSLRIDASLATVGYIDRRFGSNNPSFNIGPWVRLSGDTMSGTLTINRYPNITTDGVEQGFILRGKIASTGSSNLILMSLKYNDTKPDYMAYHSQEKDADDALLNKKQIHEKVDTEVEKLIPLSGTVSGKDVTGEIKLADNLSEQEDSYDNKSVVSKEYVDTRPMGRVSDTEITEEGYFWAKDGNLYFNHYT